MKLRHWITAIVLLLLTAAAIAGLVWTRHRHGTSEDVAALPGTQTKANPTLRTVPQVLVDQSPLQTARRIGPLAYTQEEKELARQVEKVADHEVDLAFFDAFRAAQENPPPLTPPLKQLADKKDQAQRALQEDQNNVGALNKKIAAAPESQKENLKDQLGVAQAQLELDEDERDDAGEALEESGGDPQTEVQRLKQEHDDEEAHLTSYPGSAADHAEDDYEGHTLLVVVRAWKALRAKRAGLEEARQAAVVDHEHLLQQHAALNAEVQQESGSRESAKQQANGFSKNTKTPSRAKSKAAADAALDSLKHHRQDQKNLADLSKRVADEQKLNDIYGRWIGLVEVRQQAALHNVIEVVLWILLVALMVYLANRLIDRFMVTLRTKNKRADTLRAVFKV